MLRSYLQNHISLKNYFRFIIIRSSFFFLSFFLSYKLNYCSAGFSVEPFNREDREQDLVSRTSESHDFLRNYKKYRMIRTCAFSCMRRNGRTHRKMTVGLFQKLTGAGVARSMNQKAQPADISSRCYLFHWKTSKMLIFFLYQHTYNIVIKLLEQICTKR